MGSGVIPGIDVREVRDHDWTSRPTNGLRGPRKLFISCSWADIQPWGGEYLAASFHHRPELAQETARKPWVDRERSQVGDGVEVNAAFHVRDIDRATKVAGVEKRR